MSADLFSDDGTSVLSTLLAIAIAVFALLFLKGFFAPTEVNRHQHGGIGNRNPPNNSREAAPQQTSTTPSATPSQQKRAIRTITISAPGLLLEERSPASFSEGATVLPSAIASLQAALIKSNTSGGGGVGNSSSTNIAKSSSLLANANVYILCQVSDDIGEAAVRAAFEFSGIIGSKQGQIPSQRFLFCETEVGKMSLVRQIEPEIHIDGESSTVEQLRRFIPRLIEVKTPPTSLDTTTEAGNSSSKVVVENFQNALDQLL